MITLAAKFKMDYRIVSIWVYQKRSSAKSTLIVIPSPVGLKIGVQYGPTAVDKDGIPRYIQARLTVITLLLSKLKPDT